MLDLYFVSVLLWLGRFGTTQPDAPAIAKYYETNNTSLTLFAGKSPVHCRTFEEQYRTVFPISNSQRSRFYENGKFLTEPHPQPYIYLLPRRLRRHGSTGEISIIRL
jgi:hypothetical protein